MALAAAAEAVQAVKDLKAMIGLTDTLKKFNIPEEREALQPLVELASVDSQITYNPKYIEEEDIYNMYLQAM